MSLRIWSPTERSTSQGYWTIEFLDRGDLVAEVQVSGEAVGDVLADLDTDDLRDAFDFLEDLKEVAQSDDQPGPNFNL